MGKHTEGPWVADEDGWIAGSNGETVCEYAGCGSHAAEWNEADLNLVLAAPELLEALEYALPYLRACVPEPRSACGDINCVDSAVAAITKAKGAQPDQR